MENSFVEHIKSKHRHEQTVLLNLTSQLLSRSKLEDLMSYLVEEVVRLFSVDACAYCCQMRSRVTCCFVLQPAGFQTQRLSAGVY